MTDRRERWRSYWHAYLRGLRGYWGGVASTYSRPHAPISAALMLGESRERERITDIIRQLLHEYLHDTTKGTSFEASMGATGALSYALAMIEKDGNDD